MNRTYVVSDASPANVAEATFFHFWTPNGLTSGDAVHIVDNAKRAGWAVTAAFVASSHGAAVEKAHAAFTARRRGKSMA